jgi:prepilin signal peptidase PulO-like enzyme (type II secretory pathway)
MYLGAVIIFLLGVTLGSFLNVVVFRTNEGTSVVKGRSRCQVCQVPIRPLDMVPVLSFFLLRGRCRNCKNAISWQYPLVEFSTGVLFLLMFFRYVYGFSVPDNLSADTWIAYLIRDFIFLAFLIIIFVYDLKYVLVLDRFTVPAMIVALLLNVWIGLPAVSLLLGGFILAGFFGIQFVVSKGAWIGGGDMRMGALMGFMLGLEQGLIALFVAYAVGAFVGVLLLITKKGELKTQVPMGTFLALATFILLFAGNAITDWYLAYFV